MSECIRKCMSQVSAVSLLLVVALTWAGVQQAVAQSDGARVSSSGKTTAPQNAASRPSSGGLNAGIKVHGHWAIETRNPDGKLVRHVEFENALASQTGADYLLGLMSGSYAAGGWSLSLQGSPSPCSSYPRSLPSVTLGECDILLPSQTYQASISGCVASAAVVTPPTTQPWCYTTETLTLTPFQGNTRFANMVLQGLAYADTTTNITQVRSNGWLCSGAGPYGAPFTPAACLVSTSNYGSTPLTSVTLTSAPCGGSGQSPCQVPVSAGQTIGVTLTISFQ